MTGEEYLLLHFGSDNCSDGLKESSSDYRSLDFTEREGWSWKEKKLGVSQQNARNGPGGMQRFNR